MKLLDKIFPSKTPDQALIEEIKRAVTLVSALSEQATSRGITVWLAEKNPARFQIWEGDRLKFYRAFRANTKEF